MTAKAALMAVFAPLVLAYGATLVWIWDSWMLPESYYAHGPLLLAVMVGVLWMRRRELSSLRATADARGWWLLAPALTVHLVGAALMIDSVSGASLLAAVPGAAWLAFGRVRLARLAPVLMLTAFAVPMPMFLTARVAFELKEMAIGSAVDVATALGVEVERRGADLLVAPHDAPLHVADACSGLRSLIALVTLGYCVAFFTGSQRGMRRWIVLLSALPIALVSNVLRIAGICWVARDHGIAFASTTGHDVLSYAAWGVDLALLLLVDRLLALRRGGAP